MLVGITALVLALLVILGPLLGKDLKAAVGDPTFDAVKRGDLPVVAGWLSYVGVLWWWSAATSSLLAAWLLRGRVAPQRFLVSAGLLSAGLGLDDLYLVHDLLWRRLTGLSEALVVLAWVLAISLWAFWQRAELGRNRRLPLLWLAGVALASSLVVDQVIPRAEGATVPEDSAKLMGIGLWSAFHIGFAAAAVREHLGTWSGESRR